MKTILLLAALIGVGLADQADMKYFLYENEQGQVMLENLTGTPDVRVSASDLTFYFFSQRNPTSGVVNTIADHSALRNSAFSASKNTLIIIHGWKNSHESDVNSHIREYSLRAHDINVFVVDWSPIAGKNYISAQGSVRKVGEQVAEFIKILQNNYGLNLNNLKLVGHSLGAQIAGCAGAALKGQIATIVGLDAAGPLFSVSNINNRLDSTDAKFVQAIHTNGGLLGFSAACGDADFYPNGGKSQPGCGLDLTGSCAHSRAYNYYAESLVNGRFTGRLCENYSSFTSGRCNSAASSRLGEFRCDTSARGDYFLTTNSNSPFAQG